MPPDGVAGPTVRIPHLLRARTHRRRSVLRGARGAGRRVRRNNNKNIARELDLTVVARSPLLPAWPLPHTTPPRLTRVPSPFVVRRSLAGEPQAAAARVYNIKYNVHD